ncbi:MAG: NUDIX domain-containing protein [Acidimicrobiia bacterium]|nr:NUDIX domain-containing protein [Acidimicrobiia bacterium]
MSSLSAGVLLYRRRGRTTEVLIAHPGGPFFAGKHKGAWSIPKGLVDPGEDVEDAARREWEEETGFVVPDARWLDLGATELRSGKRVRAWAVEGDVDPDQLQANTFTMEWPPHSGRTAEMPEIDELRWVSRTTAASLLNPAQVVFVERLFKILAFGADE